jgi:hypothetical protein
MDKIYQPSVISKTNEIVDFLVEINFFKDHEIESTDFAKKFFNDVFTEKFIEGTLDDDSLITEDEMENYLKLILVGSVLESLKEKGYINSYEDETTEEKFFLTEDGKDYLKNISNDESI